MDCPDDSFLCQISGDCLPKDIVKTCDGIAQCPDGTDEDGCSSKNSIGGLTARDVDVATTVVIPTIVACVVLVIGMLVGIHKCRKWEADRIGEMRRTRRIVQRLTARLREKNFNTLQKARRLRKRQSIPPGTQDATTSGEGTSGTCGTNNDQSNGRSTETGVTRSGAPPRYDAEPPFSCTSSPPPSYEDAVLDSLYNEFIRPCRRSTSRISIF